MEVLNTYGPACFVANKPRSSKPRQMSAHAPISLVSKNGKRLPLRAHNFRDLNREFWSKGLVVMADVLERKQAVELTAHAKDPSEMSLDELKATFDREPLTESKKAYLTAGATVHDMSVVENNAARFGTPYETVDPITAKQIAWEQALVLEGEVTKSKIRDGKISTTKTFSDPADWASLAKRIVRTMLPDAGSDMALTNRLSGLDKFQRLQITKIGAKRFEFWAKAHIEREALMDDRSRETDRSNAALIAEFGPDRNDYHAETGIFGFNDSDVATEKAAGSVPCPGCYDGIVASPLMEPWDIANMAPEQVVCSSCEREFAPDFGHDIVGVADRGPRRGRNALKTFPIMPADLAFLA